MKYGIYHTKDISSFQTSISLKNLTSTPLCDISDIPPDGIKNKAVVVQWGTCHFFEKARIAEAGGAEALLVANNSVIVSYKTTRDPGREGGSAWPSHTRNLGPLGGHLTLGLNHS